MNRTTLKEFEEDAVWRYGKDYGEEAVADLAKVLGKEYGTETYVMQGIPSLVAVSMKHNVSAETQSKGEQTEVVEYSLSPGMIVRAAKMAEWVTPWVSEIRQALFGKPGPPFADERRAVAWIKREERKFQTQAAAAAKTLVTWQRKALSEAPPGAFGFTANVGIARETIPYVERKVLHFAAANSPALHRLTRAVKELTRATGWEPVQAVNFILAGTEPVQPAFVLTHTVQSTNTPIGEGMAREWLTLRIPAEGIRFRQFLKLYNWIRQSGVARKKPVRSREVAVWQFVREHGLPREWKAWKEMHARWNKAYPKEHFNSTLGLQKAYERVEKSGC